jgi:DNA ligase-associated metallophosphoesterase
VTPVSLRFGGHSLDLLPARAAFWREQAALVVADCHFGKAASFRSHGVAVPEGGTADDLARLDSLISRTSARRLIVVGDFFHAPSGYRPEVVDQLIAWRHRHDSLRLTLVPGNHDRLLHRLPAALGLEIVGDPHAEEPFRFVHDPAAVPSPDVAGPEPPALSLCGHLHPAVRLGDRRVRGLSAPCFWLRRDSVLVLPSFGSFTGSAVICPGPGDRVLAVAAGRILEVPGALLGLDA